MVLHCGILIQLTVWKKNWEVAVLFQSVVYTFVLQTLDESKLPALYAEFVIHDRREINFKKRKIEDSDPDGEEEAKMRHKFLGRN